MCSRDTSACYLQPIGTAHHVFQSVISPHADMALTSFSPHSSGGSSEVSTDPPSVVVNTPDATSCQSTVLTWTGGQAPYSLRMLHQDNTPLEQLGSNIFGTSAAWLANVPAGSKLVLQVDFVTGEDVTRTSFSGIFTVLPGDGSCTQDIITSSSHQGELSCLSILWSPLYPSRQPQPQRTAL